LRRGCTVIFTTVGTQAPFDRMIRCVDLWAEENPGVAVTAQIGDGAYEPRHCKVARMLSPQCCRALMAQSSLIVAHAGMGTILLALELGKPVIVMPRVAALGEQRNDHQLATAEQFGSFGLIHVAHDDQTLRRHLSENLRLRAAERISAEASPRLINTLRRFLSNVALDRNTSIPDRRAREATFAPVPPTPRSKPEDRHD